MAFTIDTPIDVAPDMDIKPTYLNDFLVFKKGKNCNLVGYGDSIVTLGWMYKMNPVYILAHAIWESGWGTSDISKKKFNLFGWRAYDDSPVGSAGKYRNFDHCFLMVLSRIRSFYFDKGLNTLALMGEKYATDESWAEGICKLMNQIEDFIMKKKGG